MLDRSATALLKPLVQRLALALRRGNVSANQLSIFGTFLGLTAAIFIANEAYFSGLFAGFLSRTCDALDGAVARLTAATDSGGFLDIALDFLFYASIPLAFAVADPTGNALAAATLLAAFVASSSSFLAFAVMAAKRGLHSVAYPHKSFYFLGGLTEATETLLFFAAMCLWPSQFPLLAYVFAGLCAITAVTRIWWGWRAFA